MQHEERRVFFSRNKRKKEIFLLVIYAIVSLTISAIALVDSKKIPTIAWVGNLIVVGNLPSILRSLKYNQIRVELIPGLCEIYAGDELLSQVQVGSMSYSSFGRGGLRLKFASAMPWSDRLKLASHFFHFFGFCIDRAILPNGLFPSISDVAQKEQR